jgi:hypothetical protein
MQGDISEPAGDAPQRSVPVMTIGLTTAEAWWSHDSGQEVAGLEGAVCGAPRRRAALLKLQLPAEEARGLGHHLQHSQTQRQVLDRHEVLACSSSGLLLRRRG